MADEITVRVEGDEEAQRRLERLTLLLTDLRSFWPMLVPVVRSWFRRQFESEGAFGGHPWAPLSPVYAAYKARVRPGKGILVFTGDLKRAASNAVRTATPTTLTLTIDDPKVSYHQEGTTRMPARPLVFSDPLPTVARAELDEVADRYVRDLASRV